MIVVTRKLQFDAAHRVMEHESKCKYLHGHRYVVEASFQASTLDDLGRVIDFGVIKERLGQWIDEHWDHTTILYEKDHALGKEIVKLTNQTIFYLPANPTAENMALYLLHAVCPKLFKQSGVECISITLHETPNCFAQVTK